MEQLYYYLFKQNIVQKKMKNLSPNLMKIIFIIWIMYIHVNLLHGTYTGQGYEIISPRIS